MVNFRKNFIAKCMPTDGTVVEDSDSLSEVLRSSPEADNSKLVAYAWQHVIPAAERLTVYKQLLGITGAYPDTRATIAKLREDEAHALLNGLRGLRRFSGVVEEGLPIPTVWDIAKMVILSQNLFTDIVLEVPPYIANLPFHIRHDDRDNRDRCLAIIAIVKHVNELCSANWVDAFHVSREVFKTIDQALTKEGCVDKYMLNLKMAVTGLNLINTVAHSVDVGYHLRSCMADLVPFDRTIFLLIDKIVTGQSICTLISKFAVLLIVAIEKKDTSEASIQRCATQAIEETLQVMKGRPQAAGARPSWPREAPRNVYARQTYSAGDRH